MWSAGKGVDSTDAIGRFTDQAYNLILLAEDEARMLGRPSVEPEHLLLAAARRGNVERLLAREGIVASAIHAAVVRRGGFGEVLVLGPVPRLPASEAVLHRAIAAAAERGIRGPSTEHLLLGLAGHEDVVAILRELGVPDVVALVDTAYPVKRPPVGLQARAAGARTPPSPGPIPPVFERFSEQARLAVEAAEQSARSLESQYVEPVHLLLALLGAEQGILARVRPRHQGQFDAMAERAVELKGADSKAARLASQSQDAVGSRRFRVSTAPTGIFTALTRRLVAEDVLEVAHRLGHRSLSTGHLFLAVLESPDACVAEVVAVLPDTQRIAAEIVAALPGDERA